MREEEDDAVVPQRRNNRRLAIEEDAEIEEVKADGGPPVN